MIKRKLEICCYTIVSAIKAEEAGADRIELCDNYLEGGTTPSFSFINYAANKLSIPVNVIVRPRGGDFLYSEIEYEIIKNDIAKVKELNANGIVIGFLNPNGEINTNRTKEIVDLAYPMEVTFHRAFDMCRDPISALEKLKELGITRVLTSGGKKTALEGINLISELVKKAGDKIIIIPGSGVNENNLRELMLKTNAIEFHSSAKTFEESEMEYINKEINMGGNKIPGEFKKVSVDSRKIKMMKNILENAA